MRPADQPPWTRERRQAIGRRLQDARRNAGYTQEQLGERLDVDRRTIQNWEYGRTDLTVGHLLLYADAVGVEARDLIG